MNRTSATVFSSAFASWRPSIAPRIIRAAVLALALLASYGMRGQGDIKWNQPPVPASPTNVFYGWNQPSMENMPPIAADDWVCSSTNPVTKIRWWGSFIGWRETNLPPIMLAGFQIAFWTDVPATVGGFSHPRTVMQTNFCTSYTAKWVGWDYDPRSGMFESCFLFEQTLPQSDWFYQQPGPNGTNIFWVSIAAAYPPGPMGPLWGWKTRPRSPNSPAPDAAVSIDAPPIIEPGVSFVGGAPLWWPDPTVPWDLAFELISDYDSILTKYEQPPEVSMGIDVNATFNSQALPPMTNLLADDFPCTQSGPLTHITIWASWRDDLFPNGDPRNVRITLSIHTNVSVGPSGWSIPGNDLWLRTFNPGEFQVTTAFQAEEGWWDPPLPSGYVFPGDHLCLRYDFDIPAALAFMQLGTPQNPAIYWLDVQAEMLQVGAQPVKFGWKTSPVHWMDNAVWIAAREPYNGTAWQKLVYPSGHPKAGQPLDLAFSVATSQQISETKWSQPPAPYTPANGYNGWNEKSVYESDQIVADDWVCTNATPVTDLHWWGSFIGWSEPGPPQMPNGFVISFWKDDPQAPGNPFSHPAVCITNFTCTNFTWTFAGWDFDPRNPTAPPEACFKFDQQLLPHEYFVQPPGINIYWISIAAQYLGGQTIQYPWGWKTRPRDTSSLAPDDAVRIFSPTYVFPGVPYQSGTNIWWPTINDSWDMAFVLTTEGQVTPTEDFGDAPDSALAPGYPTLLANSGARHTVVPGVFLGNLIDAEPDGQPTLNADGDDLNPPIGPDDEDGILLFGPFLPGHPASVTVGASVAGFVSLWIDYNGDGSWLTPGDQVFNAQPVSNGWNGLSFTVPTTATGGINTYARLRFCTTAAPIALPTGQAPDGEVEDYPLHIDRLDYGDAPDPTYPTYLTNNGARHVVGPMFLGNLIDSENEGQPDATATGDDLNPPLGVDDEDGVVFQSALVALVPNTITVTTSVGGYLQAWIDLNADGDWADANEQVIVDRLLGPGANAVTFTVPYLTNAPKTFARFRLSGLTGLGYTGLAPDGEVEDYEIKIQSLKWVQEPEIGSEGVDVDNQWALADDFQCTQSGPITDFHIWGSFRGDRLPQGGPTNMNITLTLYSDVPIGPGNPYSHPGGVLWQRTFAPGTFDAALCTRTSWGEWWYNPAQPPPQFPGDTNIYQFDFYVDGTNAFTQVKGTIYWLGVKHTPQGPTSFEFGWKTTFRNSWNDDACWLDTSTGLLIWRDLKYLPPHPKAGTSMDLAFAVSGEAREVLDLGDAPGPYPTLLANNGARHTIVPGMNLGALIDSENDGQPNGTATGDDLAGLADEDGVLFPVLVPGQPMTVTVTVTGTGLLNAWVDFAADGSWAQPGDQIFTNVPLSTGVYVLNFTVPTNALWGATTFGRFRFSTAANLSYTDLAPDGEVEDYMMNIHPLPIADLGDAPDSSNHGGGVMIAYPKNGAVGTVANYPTVYGGLAGVPPIGPIHNNVQGIVAFLGNAFTGEMEADVLADQDFINNIMPATGTSDLDGADDGLQAPVIMPHCGLGQMTVQVTWAGGAMTPMWLNVWCDWNRDGDWNDTPVCPDGTAAPEWAGQNIPVAPGQVVVPVPPFRAWHPSLQQQPIWIRFTLAEQPVPGPLGFTGAGGDGPVRGYQYGETEDSYLTNYDAQQTFDFGDAPAPYPTLLANNGALHQIVQGFQLGVWSDAEADGLPDPLAKGDDNNNLADEDGITWTTAPVLGSNACVKVLLTGPVGGFLDAWLDFNKNGIWGDQPAEQIFASQALVNGANPGLCFLVPTNVVLGTNFARFRLTSVGGVVPTGAFRDGEVEDYAVVIKQRAPAANIVITNIVVTNLVTSTLTGQVVTVQWNAEAGIVYQMRATTNLSGAPTNLFWTDVGGVVIGPANTQRETNIMRVERYYRVLAPYTLP